LNENRTPSDKEVLESRALFKKTLSRCSKLRTPEQRQSMKLELGKQLRENALDFVTLGNMGLLHQIDYLEVEIRLEAKAMLKAISPVVNVTMKVEKPE
jgi:hypothetical protein